MGAILPNLALAHSSSEESDSVNIHFCYAHAVQEQRANFAIWAILKSPLIVGTDLRRLSKAARNNLTAEEVIAVNQDKLGVAGDLIWKRGPTEVKLHSAPKQFAIRHK